MREFFLVGVEAGLAVMGFLLIIVGGFMLICCLMGMVYATLLFTVWLYEMLIGPIGRKE